MRVLLLDDHPLIVTALRELLSGLGPDVHTVGAGQAAQALGLLESGEPFDLVLLDLHLPDRDGFDVLAEMRAAWPRLPVVVVSSQDRDADVSRALAMGAMGFIPKRATHEVMREAVLSVLSGKVFVPPPSLRDGPQPGPPPPARPPVPEGPPVRLTRRQAQVLDLLLQGQSNKVIARQLGLSSETVKDHVQGVLRALGVATRTQAVLIARERPRLTVDALDSEFGVGGG